MDIFYATFGAGMAAVLYGLLRLERENRVREQSIRALLDALVDDDDATKWNAACNAAIQHASALVHLDNVISMEAWKNAKRNQV